MNSPFAVTRRQFLKTGGALVVGFSFADSIAEALGQAPLSAPKDFKSVDAWLAIDGNGHVTVFSGHVELGTGGDRRVHLYAGLQGARHVARTRRAPDRDAGQARIDR